MRIAFVYLPGRLSRLDDARAGRVPTDFFYGAIEMEKRGHHIDYFELSEQQRHSIFQLVVRYGRVTRYLPIKTYAESLEAAWHMRSLLNGCDVVVATTNGSAFSLGIWKKLHCFSPPLVAIVCGLLNYPVNKPRAALTRSLLQQMHSHLFGQGELEPVKQAYQVTDDCLEVNCFGVDLTFWSKAVEGEREEYVLSIGNDSRRDYETLVEAARRIDRRFIVVTRRELPASLPANLEVICGSWDSDELDDAALRELYRKASCVVVPIKQGVQPSGQSVALQAMACGTPVVLTQTRGLWEEEHLIDRHNVMMVPPESAEVIAEVLSNLFRDRALWERLSANGRAYVEKHGAIGQFSRRLEESCRRALQ